MAPVAHWKRNRSARSWGRQRLLASILIGGFCGAAPPGAASGEDAPVTAGTGEWRQDRQTATAILAGESFDNAASLRDTLFADCRHVNQDATADAGATARNLVLAAPGRGGKKKCLTWPRVNSGWYVAKTPSFTAATGAITVSFWVNMATDVMYHWNFELQDGAGKPFLVLRTSQKDNAPGFLKWLGPDDGRPVLGMVRRGWTQIKIEVDLQTKTGTVYYGDMAVPVGADLPLCNPEVNATTAFFAAFTGISSVGEPTVSIDDFSVRAWTPPPARRTMAGSVPLANTTNGHTVTAGISTATGALTALRRDDTTLLTGSNDLYTLQGDDTAGWGWENDDRVVSSSGDDMARTLICCNRRLPGIRITKKYFFDAGGDLRKRIQFSTTKTTGFITYQARVAVDDAFKAQSYPCGVPPALGGPETLKWQGQGLNAYPYRITADNRLGLNICRDQVNDRYVLNNHPAGMEDVTNIRDGWAIRVFADYLQPSTTPSGEVAFHTFEGDFVDFTERMAATSDRQRLFKDARPDWTRALACDAMYAGTAAATAMAQALAPLPVTSTIWFLAPPWGNWWGNSEPPKSRHHDVQAISTEMRGASANAKISAYTNSLFDEKSEIFLKHPSFGVFGRNGDLLGGGWLSDVVGAPTHGFQLLDPEAKKYWLNMHADRMAWQRPGWSLDFFYMDGPGCDREELDWKRRVVAQAYDWADYYAELKKRIRATNDQAVFFTNGMVPHSDIGYIEAGDAHWQTLNGTSGNWCEIARGFLIWKLSEAPGYTTVLMYDRPGNQPALSAYTIAYGWCGQSDIVAHKPWLLAALEYRGLRLVHDGLARPWWRQTVMPPLEACAFRKGDNVVVNAIRHDSGSAAATVELECAKLGLTDGQTYLCQELNMTAPDASPVPTRAFTRASLTRLSATSGTLRRKISTTNARLTSLLISEAWCIVEKIGRHDCETGISDNYGVVVDLQTRNGATSTYAVTVNATYGAAGATLFFPWATAVTLSPAAPATVTAATVNGVQGLRVALNAAGSHTATVTVPPHLVPSLPMAPARSR